MSLVMPSWIIRNKPWPTIMWYKKLKNGRFLIKLPLHCRNQWFFASYVWRNFPYCQANSLKGCQMMVGIRWLKHLNQYWIDSIKFAAGFWSESKIFLTRKIASMIFIQSFYFEYCILHQKGLFNRLNGAACSKC